MKGKLKRKKKRFWRPAAAGFIVLYMATMGLVTCLVKEKFMDEYTQTFTQNVEGFLEKATEQEMSAEEKELSDRQRKEFYQNLVNIYFWSTGDSSMQISAAVYDKEKKLLVKSDDTIGDMSAMDTSDEAYGIYVLDDYMSSEQKEELASYQWEQDREFDDVSPEKYRFLFRVSPDGQELWAVYVQRLTWEEGNEAESKKYEDPLTKSINSVETGVKIDYETGEEIGEVKTFYETDSEVVWEWKNGKVSDKKQKNGKLRRTSLSFPYMHSYEDWHRWSSSEYLHGFPAYGRFEWEDGSEAPGFVIDADQLCYRGKYQLQVGFAGDPYAYIEVRLESRPWFAALDYMKYVYLAGGILTIVCMLLIVYAFHKTYDRQAALEETRRDITNALAHELKTPLGVIRNFAENLAEHNMEEKRDYYLSQIIGQTEEMDRLVKEMIELSKLDSEELVLRKEQVSFSGLIREQAARFAPEMKEKNLHVQYQEEEDFLVEADREYLAKAVWNLLSNAVNYNVTDGSILIRIEADRCMIENTGEPMDEEQLLHAFDMFYIGDKSRGRKEKHMGVGLFLTKKILGLHGMSLALENTNEGVRAVIKK